MLLNITQFIFHASFFKLTCAKPGIDWRLASLCFLTQVVWMREEYNSVLSTPIEADNISRFGRYRYIGKTQISASIIYLSSK